MPVVSSLNRKRRNHTQDGVRPTDNKYVLLNKTKSPYIDSRNVHAFLDSFPNSPIINNNGHKQSGVKLFMKDNHKGFRHYIKHLDLKNKHKETTEGEFEDYFTKAISLYLYKEPDKFPEGGNLDLNPKDFEDPDDAPPTDMGLDEIGLTINDFKL